MTEYTIALTLDTQLLSSFLILIFIGAAVFTYWKIRRLPRAIATSFSQSLARLVQEQPDGEAYFQLQEALAMAWEKKSWEPLVPLIGNPIVQKAWLKFQPLISGLAVKGGTAEGYA